VALVIGVDVGGATVADVIVVGVADPVRRQSRAYV
jgi:hypothetical protein